jgi:hypothetical protein
MGGDGGVFWGSQCGETLKPSRWQSENFTRPQDEKIHNMSWAVQIQRKLSINNL